MKRLSAIRFFLLIGLICLISEAVTANIAGAGTSKAITEGWENYLINCLPCHGGSGNKIFPALISVSKKDFVKYTVNGKSDSYGTSPKFKKTLTKAQITNIYLALHYPEKICGIGPPDGNGGGGGGGGGGRLTAKRASKIEATTKCSSKITQGWRDYVSFKLPGNECDQYVCFDCHGGRGNRIPIYDLTKSEFIKGTLKGKKGSDGIDMPSYKGYLTKKQITAIYLAVKNNAIGNYGVICLGDQ